MNLSDFVIIVPIKSLDLAKSRLKYHITEKERFNIIINMFLGVLKASKKSLSKEVWIICKDKIFKDICDFFNVRWIEDEGYGLNIILNDVSPSGFQYCSGDKREDENIDILDIISILNEILGE